ncbi:MAG: rfaE1 [Burkholderiales bacterium]|nr:rfaE1 [Burkholderiales bacterium]
MSLSNTTLEKIKKSLNQNKILVVGDVMLDRYWFGDVNRISPEAPVPIAKINKIEDRPGGAANVARNVASLNGNVTLLSVVGNDEPATTLKEILINDSVNTIFKPDNSIRTIVKLRVLAKNQQLIRLDFEEPPSHEILSETLEIYNEIIDDYDIVILSDYGKGGLNHAAKMIEIANSHNKQILIDPKGNDYSKYKNATLITPNKTEFKDAVGMWHDEAEFKQKAINLKNQLNLNHLLVTRSEEGMSLFDNDSQIDYPTVAHEVYDVSGAGDTVIGTLGLMLANNIPLDEAVMLSNIAAGIVVAKVGTATLTLQELIQQIRTLGYTNFG